MNRVWAFTKKNFDILLTILGAIFVAALGLFSVVTWEIISAATLMILSLIGVSLLLNRNTNSRLEQTLESTLDHLQRPSADQILMPYGRWMDEIEHRLWLAREVWILSRTCTRLWEDYNEQLMRLLSYEGAAVRIMMVDPNNGAVNMIVGAAEGFEHTANVDIRRATIADLLRRLTQLRSRLKAENLQVRTIDYLPAWTLVIIDPLSDKGMIYVELATFRANSRNRPTLSLA